jgi:hypothetical protein
VAKKRTAVKNIKRKAFTVKSVLNSDQHSFYLCGMRSVSILFLFMIFHLCSFSQDLSGYRFSMQVSLNRMDLFSGLRVERQFDHLETSISLEVGVNRTIFQTRFFPRVSVGAGYNVLKKDNIRIGPAFAYGYSVLQVNKSSGSLHRWNELYGGYTLSIGKTWRFSHSLMSGWMNERYRNQVSTETVGVHTFGYYCSLGVSYAW